MTPKQNNIITKIPADEKKAFEQLIKSYRKKHIRTSHNIIVVAYSWISESDSLASMRNIISFEDYLFEEIPSILKFGKSSE
ncbi:hypothetical protein BSPWISOXPB_9164 [uncultured Gammaproteobacteria bacterium]|nr:hypothetical protein BSPWISOXPB_9164 [uncultured Gammaproteobacteria bacterium]